MTFTPSKSAVGAAIAAGCFIAFVGFGFSAAFGILLRPMSSDLGWGREVFSLSLAVQGLFWGFAQPIAGAIADRHGTARVLGFGAIVAAAGFWMRGAIIDPTVFVASGVVVGIGTGACSFPVVIVALSKIVAPEQRSFVMGLGTAAASTGLFVGAPALQALLDWIDWRDTIFLIAASFLTILLPLVLVARVARPTIDRGEGGQLGRVIKTAFGERAFLLLFVGFFVCGFHVAFIQTHLPAYIEDEGLDPSIGAWSLALIGLFNIFGSFASGWAGARLSKKSVLAAIYTARAGVIVAFVLTPMSPMTVLVFSAVMGVLWLSTVPLTTGLIAQTQGVRFLSTLTGLIFLSHQAGMFAGAWLGGLIFDLYGSYLPMWWSAVAFGLAATAIHLPIDERPGRLAEAEAKAVG